MSRDCYEVLSYLHEDRYAVMVMEKLLEIKYNNWVLEGEFTIAMLKGLH